MLVMNDLRCQVKNKQKKQLSKMGETHIVRANAPFLVRRGQPFLPHER
jgi:hypothetical protein